MALSISNESSRVIGVSNGLRIPGIGYIYINRFVTRFLCPHDEFVLSYQNLQEWPGAELAVELWLEGSDHHETVIVPNGGKIAALDSDDSLGDRSDVDIFAVHYTDETRTLAEMVPLTTIYTYLRG